jgi:uncharacterized protein YciI
MSAITPLTIVRGEYLAPLEQVDVHRDAHFTFMDGLVGDGRVLMAGRRTPADGSILVFRGEDADAALGALASDPYVAAGVVRYEAVGVFTPGRHAPALAELLAGG